MISDVDYLYMYLLVIFMPSLAKYMFSFLANFLLYCFAFLLLSCMSSLYILYGTPLSDMICKYFLLLYILTLHILIISFKVLKLAF